MVSCSRKPLVGHTVGTSASLVGDASSSVGLNRIGTNHDDVGDPETVDESKEDGLIQLDPGTGKCMMDYECCWDADKEIPMCKFKCRYRDGFAMMSECNTSVLWQGPRP